MSNDKKVIVAYLYTKFDIIDNLSNFINYYKKNSAGNKHDLLICYKLLTIDEIEELRKITKNIPHIEFIDDYKINDYDFGSYKRIAKKYPNSPIFFMLGHCYPVSPDWLKKIMSHFDINTLIGSSGSNESIFSSFKIKKKFKLILNLKNYFFLKKNFKNFPNPHLRTTNFVLYGRDFLKFINNKSLKNKKDAWICESGFNGMTNFFLDNGFKIFIINSENMKFSVNDFKLSESYCFKNQSKQLFSDKHSRKYQSLNSNDKLNVSKNVWG